MTEIGLAASIVIIIQVSEEIMAKTYKYGKPDTAAKSDMKKVEADIRDLQSALQKLRDLAESESSSHSLDLGPPRFIRNRGGPLDKCQASLEILQPCLKPISLWEETKARAQWQKQTLAALRAVKTGKDLLKKLYLHINRDKSLRLGRPSKLSLTSRRHRTSIA